MRVQVEVSLYPLRTEKLSEPINAFCRTLIQRGLDVESGPMSTHVSGKSSEVFDALRQAFNEVAQDYQVVLAMRMSNACPDNARAPGGIPSNRV